MMKFVMVLWVLTALFFETQWVEANEVKVLDAVVKREVGLFGDSYLFDVTLEHNDEGSKHFVDRWEIWTADGKTLLDTRKLLHPHVDEQPFTRSLSGVDIPEGVTQVLIRAHDNLHGDSPHTLIVTLPVPERSRSWRPSTFNKGKTYVANSHGVSCLRCPS